MSIYRYTHGDDQYVVSGWAAAATIQIGSPTVDEDGETWTEWDVLSIDRLFGHEYPSVRWALEALADYLPQGALSSMIREDASKASGHARCTYPQSDSARSRVVPTATWTVTGNRKTGYTVRANRFARTEPLGEFADLDAVVIAIHRSAANSGVTDVAVTFAQHPAVRDMLVNQG